MKLAIKKLSLVLILFSFSVIVSVGQDTKAGAVLDAMSTHYKALKSFKADFSYAPVSASGKAAKAKTGSITVKGVKFKLNMVGQEIYNDGSEIYTFVKETNEVNITEYDAGDDSEFSPANIYSIYKKGYKYIYKGEKTVGGEPCQLVELTPTKAGNVKKVEISVGKSSRNIKAWKIWDNTGRQTAFAILKFSPNVSLSDTHFKFNASNHPGVEVVDLR